MQTCQLPRASGWAAITRSLAEQWGFKGANWRSQFIAWLKSLEVRVQAIERSGFRTRYAYRQDEFHLHLSNLSDQSRSTHSARNT